MVASGDFGGRRAPYAPISSLERFLELIRNRSVPEHVDHRFLQKLNVASNNEYSLLSALKFLAVVDDRGQPTHTYRLLQSTDRFQDTLRHLVHTAYRPLFDLGVEGMSTEDLINYFRSESSASQAKNAARFFLAVCRLAGLRPGKVRLPQEAEAPGTDWQEGQNGESPANVGSSPGASDLLLAAKARLLEKLPPPRSDWSAGEYKDVCASFLQLLRNLDGSDHSVR